MRSISLAVLSATALLATACASNPPPEPTPAPVEPAAPVVARPAPITPAPAPTAGPVAGSKADFAAKNTDRVYFDYDQYNLDDADRRALAGQASWLKQYAGARVQIEGNADERGTREYNIALSARRANAVSDYLKSQGIDGARVSTLPNGKDKPLDPGHDESSWSRNRNAYTNVVSESVS